MPTAPRKSGTVLQELHCPLHLGSVAVYCRSSTAYCPKTLRQSAAGVALPLAPVLQELHCPLPPGSDAFYCRISTAHCP